MGEKYNGKLKPQEGSNTFLSFLTREQEQDFVWTGNRLFSTLEVTLAVVIFFIAPAAVCVCDDRRPTKGNACLAVSSSREKKHLLTRYRETRFCCLLCVCLGAHSVSLLQLGQAASRKTSNIPMTHVLESSYAASNNCHRVHFTADESLQTLKVLVT